MEKHLDALIKLAKDQGREDALIIEKELNGFRHLYSRHKKMTTDKVDWSKIQPPSQGMVQPYNSLKKTRNQSIEWIRDRLNKLVVLKLNGGLGTSMGCVGPKSIIEVRDGMTFLDLVVRQIQHLNETYDVSVPLVLMNSFNTQEDTEKIIRKYAATEVDVCTFMQSRYPRYHKDTQLPAPGNFDDKDHWYPPGHGDTYEAFVNSGLVDRLLAEGKTWVFCANIDNLGSTVDIDILSHMIENEDDCEFCMEVTDKTLADIKGGTLINYEGTAKLLEVAQVPKDKLEEFKSVKKFKIFNTNNIWVKLDAFKAAVESKSIDMDIIVNGKKLKTGEPVIQLEQAIGAAISAFKGAIGINVPRSRFLPVKNTSDLLLIKSNLFSIRSGGLIMNPARAFPVAPSVKLGGDHFGKVKNFTARFKDMPDIIELNALTVNGDVTFGKGVSLKGTVIIVANPGECIDIPSGAVLENKIVGGNIRILDH
eukprot:Clim_evm1s87 gene=Clim_evmTU1s87